MMAIATSMDAKAVDHGRVLRAARPVAGFGFEQLFTATALSVDAPEDGAGAVPDLEMDRPVVPAEEAMRAAADGGADAGADAPVDADPLAAEAPAGDDDDCQPLSGDALANQEDPDAATALPFVVTDGAQAPVPAGLGLSDAMVGCDPSVGDFGAGDGQVGVDGPVAAGDQSLDPVVIPVPSRAVVAAGAVAVDPALPVVAEQARQDAPAVTGLPEVAAEGPAAAPVLQETGPVDPAGQQMAESLAPLRIGAGALAEAPMAEGDAPPAATSLPVAMPANAADAARAVQERMVEAAEMALLPEAAVGYADMPAGDDLPSAPPQVAPPAPPVDMAEAALSPLPKVTVASLTAAMGEKPSGAERGGAVSRLAPQPQPDGTGKSTRVAGDSARPASEGMTVPLQDMIARADLFRTETAQAAAERAEPLATAPLTGRANTSAPLPPAPLTAPPALPLAMVLNMRQANWGKQLLAQIEGMVSSGQQRIDLSLRPKNLGQIEVSLDMRGDQTSVRIVSETAAAARLLGRAEERLAQILDQSGYRLSGFSVQEQGTGGHGGQQGQPAPRRARSVNDINTREEPSKTLISSPYGAERGRSTGINMLA